MLTKGMDANERRGKFRLLMLLLLLAFSNALSVDVLACWLLIEVVRRRGGGFGVSPVIELLVAVDDDITTIL